MQVYYFDLKLFNINSNNTYKAIKRQIHKDRKVTKRMGLCSKGVVDRIKKQSVSKRQVGKDLEGWLAKKEGLMAERKG